MAAEEAKNMVESTRARVPRWPGTQLTPLPPPAPNSATSHAPPPPPPPRPQSNSRTQTLRGSGFADPFLLQNRKNFGLSTAPARFMYYQNGAWLNFAPGKVLEHVRSGFLERKPLIEVSIDGSDYVFDFLRMLQIDLATGSQRSIAWIDENEKCFFPKIFVAGDEREEGDFVAEEVGNSVIKLEIKIDGHDASVKRKRDEEAAEQSLSKKGEETNKKDKETKQTKRQRLLTADAESSRWANARLLTEEKRAYELVKNHFMSGIKKVDASAMITSIHQYVGEGPLEKARYEVFEKQIEFMRTTRGIANIAYAWYGASVKEVESVLAHGFGLPSKVLGPDCHGVGVYLSPLGFPHLSAKLAEADGNGERHLVLCRVILGSLEKVEAGSKQSHPSSLDFDNGVDDPMNPKWYVVWLSNANRHVLPECVVTFKPSNLWQGQLGGLISAKYPFEKLFSKLKGSLPPQKFQTMQNLHSALRAGKMTKEVFVMNLRTVVGDQMLRSVVQEVLGNE